MSRNEEVEVESAVLLHQLTHWRNLFLFSQGPGSTGLGILMTREGMLFSGHTILVPLKFNFHWPKVDGNQRAKMPIRVMYKISPPGTQIRVEKYGEWILRGKQDIQRSLHILPLSIHSYPLLGEKFMSLKQGTHRILVERLSSHFQVKITRG